MPIILLFLFIGFPILELYTIVRVSQIFGFWQTMFYLLAVTILGFWVTKFRGRWLLKSIQEQAAKGQVPAAEVIQGVFVFFAGLLFIFPGFVSDAMAVVLIFPLTQWAIALLTKALMARLIAKGSLFFYNMRTSKQGNTPDSSAPIVVEVTAEDISTPSEINRLSNRDERES